MLTVAAPEAAEARCNATFEALMWSMARPGQVRELPEPGLAPIVEALIDRECAAYTDSAALASMIADTGAVLTVDLAVADHLFLEELTGTSGELAAIRCGSALYPDDGATLVAQVAHGTGQRLRFTGPGIDGFSDMMIALPPEFWAMRARLCAYPEGFDLLLLDGRSVIAIPRSTQIEVL
jgi:alpha-D-ribose 1-methylphosphonate 5-triphosphate synthase subunit PhnH